jgi:hypothetical protein
VQEGERPDVNGASATGSRSAIPFRASPDSPPGVSPQACRFLVLEQPDGTLGPAGSAVDQAHRCVALGDPLPQSSRQQELVCLTDAHTTCPRYLRGMLIQNPPPQPARREPVSTAVIVAALVFLGAIAASFAFLGVRGGFAFAGAPTTGPSLLAAAPSSTVSAAPSVPLTATPVPSIATSPTPSEAPTPTVSPTPSPTPAPTARPVRTPAPTPGTSDRFAVLTRCPSTPDCWVYVIRSGDNLFSIAHWFGVDYDRMRAMNPNLRVPIHAGDDLRIPTPTR